MLFANKKYLGREEWIDGAMNLIALEGEKGVKIVSLAKQLGVTSGSFYYHFSNRRELLDALLERWETLLTDDVGTMVEAFAGSPRERIHRLMDEVMSSGAARLDLVFWHWAQTDAVANVVFRRVLTKRLKFTRSLYEQAGFDSDEAEARGRLMVFAMMGESTLTDGDLRATDSLLDLQCAILTRRTDKLH